MDHAPKSRNLEIHSQRAKVAILQKGFNLKTHDLDHAPKSRNLEIQSLRAKVAILQKDFNLKTHDLDHAPKSRNLDPEPESQRGNPTKGV